MSESAPKDLVAIAARVLDIESRAVKELAARLDSSFSLACEVFLNTEGRIVVTGMGKSGHIAGKIAATFASTGTPSFFMHPAEAGHGDLGMITAQDSLLAISYSGETGEIVTILPLVKRLGVKLIAITGNPRSTLAKAADVHINVHVSEEACPLNLTPTASTTAMLAMGDALGVALLEYRGFTAEDFARSHPSGSLGKKLLMRVSDVMHSGDAIPSVRATVSVSEGLIEMTQKGLGVTAIVDDDNRILGIFTDGDLRRTLDSEIDVRKSTMQSVMHADSVTIRPDVLAAEAVRILDENKITALLVADDENHLVGALNVHDLFRAGVM